jgi:hypothetical protein
MISNLMNYYKQLNAFSPSHHLVNEIQTNNNVMNCKEKPEIVFVAL